MSGLFYKRTNMELDFFPQQSKGTSGFSLLATKRESVFFHWCWNCSNMTHTIFTNMSTNATQQLLTILSVISFKNSQSIFAHLLKNNTTINTCHKSIPNIVHFLCSWMKVCLEFKGQSSSLHYCSTTNPTLSPAQAHGQMWNTIESTYEGGQQNTPNTSSILHRLQLQKGCNV